MAETKTKIPTKEYTYRGINFTEKILINKLSQIDFEATESYLLYESQVTTAGKTYNIKINFDQGRKTTNFLHTIIAADGRRSSLGFSNNITQLKKSINEFIFRHSNA